MEGAKAAPLSARRQPRFHPSLLHFVFGPPLLLIATTAFAAQPLPPDVARFVERREVCEHFRGEPWPEGRTQDEVERRSFIARELAKHCAGSDAQFAALRRKYRDDQRVIRTLERYENAIEAK